MGKFTDAQIEAEEDKALSAGIEDYELLRAQRRACSCAPCESPAYDAPGYAHCAACCYGSMIEAYDHDCPVAEHREMAHRQFPLDRMIPGD